MDLAERDLAGEYRKAGRGRNYACKLVEQAMGPIQRLYLPRGYRTTSKLLKNSRSTAWRCDDELFELARSCVGGDDHAALREVIDAVREYIVIDECMSQGQHMVPSSAGCNLVAHEVAM